MWLWQVKYTACRRKRQSCQDREDALKTCGYCGLYGAHPKGWACPAFRKRCYKCHKIDHYGVACRTKLNRHSDVNGHYIKDQHGFKCMGHKIQTKQIHKMDGFHSNVVQNTIEHLIVNRLQKTGIFEEYSKIHFIQREGKY